MRENHSAYHKIWFRPRILHDVENIDLSTKMLGTKVNIPFYVTATALGKLGNPEGEVILTKGAKKHGVIQVSGFILLFLPLASSKLSRNACLRRFVFRDMSNHPRLGLIEKVLTFSMKMIPTLASCSFDEIVDAKEGDVSVPKSKAPTFRIWSRIIKRYLERVYSFVMWHDSRHCTQRCILMWRTSSAMPVVAALCQQGSRHHRTNHKTCREAWLQRPFHYC